MRRLAVVLTLLASPAFGEDAPKSEAGTAFMQTCLADVTAHRIATLKKQVPEYAASLSDDELTAGAMPKAKQACPCFLQVIAVDPASPIEDVEAKVAFVVSYLDAQSSETPQPMPAIVARLTRLCGERSSIMPPTWIGN